MGETGQRKGKAEATAETARKREHPKEAPGYGDGCQAPERRKVSGA